MFGAKLCGRGHLHVPNIGLPHQGRDGRSLVDHWSAVHPSGTMLHARGLFSKQAGPGLVAVCEMNRPAEHMHRWRFADLLSLRSPPPTPPSVGCVWVCVRRKRRTDSLINETLGGCGGRHSPILAVSHSPICFSAALDCATRWVSSQLSCRRM